MWRKRALAPPRRPGHGSLRIYRGLAGAGKSSRMIAEVNAALAEGRPVATFACRESPRIMARPEYTGANRILACRQPGLTCPLHHLASTSEARAILAELPVGALVAIEEAYEFGPEAPDDWIAAAGRGLEIIIVMPSHPQRERLLQAQHEDVLFRTQCERCKEQEATSHVIVPGQDATRALCEPCRAAEVAEVRRDLLVRLREQGPYPGEEAIYQPIEFSECDNWQVNRPDSAKRVELMTGVLREARLLPPPAQARMTYLDVGCNTGYFCHAMHGVGFHATGVDVMACDIEVAQILDSYFRLDQNVLITEDAYSYLERTQDVSFDVTSAFAVFQWLMIQTTVERGVQCLEWLFAKTRRICFVEMGYGTEKQYEGKLPRDLDPDWVFHVMRTKGDFAEVRMYEASKNQLQFGSRDLFVGFKG